MLKISVITPSYNSEKYISHCINSVIKQNYPNFEHIIVDGKSSDKTVEIIKTFPHIKFISEDDEGLSDALNKGLDLCSGDIICWLNSDDYYEGGTFESVNSIFCNNPKRSWLIGMTSRMNQSTGKKKINPYYEINIKSIRRNCDYLRTMASFYRKNVFNKIRFNKKLNYVMDYQLYLDVSKKYGEPINSKIPFSVFRVHDEQKTNVKNLRYQYLELLEIFYKNKLVIAFLNKTIKFIKLYFILKLKTLFKA